jgi:hypothetical protein
MLNASPLIASFKLQAQTSASAVIATVTGLNFYGDGSVTFTGTDGVVRQYEGDNANINMLLQMLLTGTGGFAAGTKLAGNA